MHDGKRVVITYGTYDLLHHGHTRLMERAKALGDYLIVGVTSDAFDRDRGKLNVFQPLSDRLNAVLATGIPDKVIVEEFQGQKISDIQKYGVDVFAIGSDWEGRFDFLKEYCEVVYLPRTEGVSSTELRAENTKTIRIGCIGADYFSARIVREGSHVASIDVAGVCALAGQDVHDFEELGRVTPFEKMADLLAAVDAAYISAPINERAELIRTALQAQCHVLCESPMFLSRAEGESLYALAESKGLVLMEALKTLYLPAFEHLRLLIASGVIGEVKDIRASYSHVFSALDKNDVYQGSFYDMGAYAVLPAIALLGNDFRDARMVCSYEGEFCTWTKVELLYARASATLNAGRGMKTEGDLVITGTDGYIYVPAPWWKTDYFEVRSEDLRDTRKFYFGCAGEGQRYELFEFVARVNGTLEAHDVERSKADVLAVSDLVERFDKGDVIQLEHGRHAFGGGERVTDR